MALLDYRRLIEAGADVDLAVEVTTPGRIALDVLLAGMAVRVELDEPTAGALFDALAGAISASVQRSAVTKLHPRDTPRGSRGVS